MPMPVGLTVERVIGDVRGSEPGPTVVVFGGLHGNEPAGVLAPQRVLKKLPELPLRGRFLALGGNLPALKRNLRFIERDLNRRWWEPELDELLARDPEKDSLEDRQQRELLTIIHELHAEADEPIIFLDLHSTSGDGAPFCCMADTLRNRRIAFTLPVPLILGLEETIDGAMMGILSDLGHIGVVVEGGQHTDPWTTAFLESSMWLCLVAGGALKPEDVPDYQDHHDRLAQVAKGLPRFVEIRYRHRVTPDDEFRMLPGFRNFQRITREQPLANDTNGPVHAQEGGRILMPLYQVQGEDGYFIARDVNRFWLWLSGVLRRLRFDRLIPWLPGIRRHPDKVNKPDHFVVNQRVARFFAIEVFHLFGYRRRHLHEDGKKLVFSRRRPDFRKTKKPR